jgi:hypothetical protein
MHYAAKKETPTDGLPMTYSCVCMVCGGGAAAAAGGACIIHGARRCMHSGCTPTECMYVCTASLIHGLTYLYLNLCMGHTHTHTT